MEEQPIAAAQAPAKRARTAAQEAAFQAMIEARDRKVYERMRAAEAQPAAEAPVAAAAAEPEEGPVPPVQMVSAHEEQPAMHSSTLLPAAAEQQQPAYNDYEDDIEFVDVNELMQQLQSTQHKLQALEEQFGGLHTQYGDLSSAFKEHGVRQKHEINFV